MGSIRYIFHVYSRGFLLLHRPMDPATGWGVHWVLCADMLCSVRVKKKRIRESYDYVNWSKGRLLSLWVVTSTYM